MENTVGAAAGASLSERSAARNAKSAANAFKLALLWLLVGIPMVWGMLKALEGVQNLFR